MSIRWIYQKGKLTGVGCYFYVDEIKKDPKKYLLIKDGVEIGKLDRSEHYIGGIR